MGMTLDCPVGDDLWWTRERGVWNLYVPGEAPTLVASYRRVGRFGWVVAEGTFGTSSWSLEMRGAVRPRYLFRVGTSDSHDEPLQYRRTGGWRLSGPAGERYRLKPNFTDTEVAVFDESGEPLIELARMEPTRTSPMAMRVASSALAPAQLAGLIVVTLHVLIDRETAAWAI